MAAIERLLTEQRNPASEAIDACSTSDMLRIINEEDRKVAAAVAAELPRIADAVDGIAARLAGGGRLYYIGAGTSGRLGVLDASECRPTFNVPDGLVQGIIAGGESALVRATEASEDDPASGANDLLQRGFTAADVLVGIAASGRTPYVLGAVAKARELGALTIGICCTPDALLSQQVHIPIAPLAGPEIITGSTRMKAGTATKMVLNMLSTGAMIRLGYVYGNLMVNVQPTNDKLRDRARRIIMAAAEVPREEAAALLESSGRSVRAAIVMARLRVDRAAAESLLARAGNRVGQALAAGAGSVPEPPRNVT